MVRDAGFEPVLPMLNIKVRRGPPAHFPERAAETRRNGRNASSTSRNTTGQRRIPPRSREPRSAARQLVSHGHVLVNGRTVNIASFNVKAGAETTIKDKPKSRQLVLRNLDLTQIVPVPDWLTVDRDALSGKVVHVPSREEMQPIVNEQL